MVHRHQESPGPAGGPLPPPAGERDRRAIDRRLPSGLRLVAEPWGPVPVVSIQIWIPVGAAAEPAPLSGAAHLLEHLVFRGAGDWEGAALMAHAEHIGADLNAWTSVEQTAFHLTVPADQVSAGLALLWALVFHPWLRDADLEAERPIVLEEIRGSADDPTQVVADALRAQLHGDHPYGRSVLGTVESVSGISGTDLRRFHQERYRPEHAVLIVAGPTDLPQLEQELRSLADPPGALGVLESVPLPAVLPAREGLRLLRTPFRDIRVEIGFPTPGPTDPAIPALDVLTVALGGGPAGRLPVRLRQELDVVLGCTATMEMEIQGGAVVLSVAARAGQLVPALTGMLQVISEAGARPMDPRELDRARALVRSDRLHERETVDGRAQRLGWNSLHHGDPDGERRYELALRTVDARAVQAAALRWLRPERATLVVMAPEEEIDAAETGLQGAWRAWTQPTPRDRAVAVRAPVRPAGPVAFAGPAGLRILVEPSPGDELVGISLIGRGGSLANPADLPGACLAWSEVVERGAGPRDSVAFAAAVEARSGGLGVWSARNSCGVQASFPRDTAFGLEGGLGLIGDLLQRPHFLPEEVARTQADFSEGRALLEDDPEALAWELSWTRLFPGHPWGRPEAGSRGSIARLSPGRLRAIHRRVVTGGNLCVGVVGDVEPERVRDALFEALGGLRAGPEVGLRSPLDGVRAGRLRRRVPREDAPAQVTLAWRAVGRESPDWATALVLDGILGGAAGLGGRLFQTVREDAGLAYDLGSSLEGGLGGGAFFCTAATDPERADETLALMRSVVGGLAATPVGAEELDRVRRGLVSSALAGTQRAISRADQLAGGLCYLGRGADWRERMAAPLAVTADQVQELAARLLRDDVAVEVQVLPS